MTRFASTQLHTESLKVPRENQSWLFSPSIREAEGLVGANASLLSEIEFDLQGCSLSDLRKWTRQSVFDAASRYSSQWAGKTEVSATPGVPWVVGGHQPTLFHPGVWVKNFAVSKVASHVAGIGLNLVVDNDTIATSAVRVPTGTLISPRTVDVAFDAPQPKQPWENVRVQDEALFQSFPGRVREVLEEWGFEPLLDSFWPRVLKFHESLPRLADTFTAARNEQEREWGAKNLELPLGHLCQLPPFLWFASHILANLPRFRDVYNSAVREYRQANQIHSTSHPVPELTQLGDWLESPFWVWRCGEQRRSRLFARQSGGTLILSKDGGEALIELPLSPETDAKRAVERLQELQSQGVNIRTRALTTTLFARTCLADLFVHGIGGAKYDEITDRLISRFFGMPAPAFWVVSGTLHLPLGAHATTDADLVIEQRRVRDLIWNPAMALAQSGDLRVQELCAEFRARLGQPALDLHARRKRHHELAEIKAALSKWSNAELPQTRARIEQTARQLAANRLLQSREYSSVLYPEELLRRFATIADPAAP